MNNLEFVKKLHEVVQKKTVYMWGTFGAEVTEKLIGNKAKQYPSWYSSSKQRNLKTLIGKGYFAFDCIGLIKAILWGWDGSIKTANGGAVYLSNDVPDTNANGFINICKNVSSDFNELDIGEVVWMSGHIGVYIGNGNVIEATPSWKNGVQITKLLSRKWIKHGQIPYIEYVNNLDSGNVYMVTTANLHMREKAGVDNKSITVIPKSSIVQVYAKRDGWAMLLYKGNIGYCSLSFLKLEDTIKYGKVIANALNVRSGPGSQFIVIDVLKRNQKVEILETINHWYKIRYSPKYAYVSSKYIEKY